MHLSTCKTLCVQVVLILVLVVLIILIIISEKLYLDPFVLETF